MANKAINVYGVQIALATPGQTTLSVTKYQEDVVHIIFVDQKKNSTTMVVVTTNAKPPRTADEFIEEFNRLNKQ